MKARYKKKLLFLLLFLLPSGRLFCQIGFVEIDNSKFTVKGKEFSCVGVNIYYLHELAVRGEFEIIDSIFARVSRAGSNVIRTWGFYEGDRKNSEAIMTAPYSINYSNLRAFDYIIDKAKADNLKLIIVLANNHSDYGGKKEYLKWRKDRHSNFFTDDSMKAWYKYYIKAFLENKNSLSGVAYKEEEAIMAFELINEGANPGQSYLAILNWYKEMAAYFKEIDKTHLLTTGEIGYDISDRGYYEPDLFYNSANFLLDGSKGTSYRENTSIPDIDYATFHLYPEIWFHTTDAGISWITNHYEIAERKGKPALLAEAGLFKGSRSYFEKYLEEYSGEWAPSMIIWHYVPVELQSTYGDKYSINATELKNLITEMHEIIKERDVTEEIKPNIILYQNYPNPFNPTTNITFHLPVESYIELSLFDPIGGRIAIMFRGWKSKGTHTMKMSVNDYFLSSGVYIYSLKSKEKVIYKKMILAK